MFLGIGLSIFSAVLATIYTFKPQVRTEYYLYGDFLVSPVLQNATVSQLFCLIIAYVLGEAMASKSSI